MGVCKPERVSAINNGQANALTTPLYAALKQIDRDAKNSIKTVVNQIDAFEN